jgi:ethanolamine transporter
MTKVILYIIGTFFFISGIDYIFGNRLKLGEKFEEGIKTMGALGLAMIGIYSLAPVLASKLSYILVPLAGKLNIDPSIFTGCLFAPDMGGYQMAKALEKNSSLGTFSAVVLASTLGTTISFTIPIAMGLLKEEDIPLFSKGVLAGIITIPLGCLTGGLMDGVEYSVLLWNLVPIVVISALVAVGLLLAPKWIMKAFNIIGKGIMILSIVGLLLQGLDSILGIKLVPGLASMNETMSVVGKVAFVMGGAYPMLSAINRIFKKNFEKLGEKIGINAASVGGMIGNLASNLLIFSTYEDMDEKGKVLCAAFGVSGAFVLGGQMGFISGVAPNMLGVFMTSKLVGGIASVFAASWIYEREIVKEGAADAVN